jgi:S-(hydroxymethyl)mycothiol dehydrogenase
VARHVRGVVAGARREPVTIETVVVPDPGMGALVAVQACGVCHTDLHHREGGIESWPGRGSRRSGWSLRTTRR